MQNQKIQNKALLWKKKNKFYNKIIINKIDKKMIGNIKFNI